MPVLSSLRKIGRAPLARFLLSAFALLLPACVTMTPRSNKPSSSAAVIPDMPVLKWGIESCGAGSLATVLQHYGDSTSMRQWDATLPKTRGGVMTIDMLIAARHKGYEAEIVTGTPQIITNELTNGRPVILMLQVIDSPGHKFDFFHYIVADGIDSERSLIRTQWGDRQERWVSLAKLEKPWSGGGHTAILIHPRTPDEDLRQSLLAAVALEEDGKYADAAARYRDVIAAHPDSSVALTDLGNVEEKLGENAAAEESFRKALAADPSSRDALNNLAWLLYQEKRLDEAESLARKALSAPGPDSYLVLDTLARVLAAKGSCDEAMRTFQEAIDAVPSSQAAARSEIEEGLRNARRSCS